MTGVSRIAYLGGGALLHCFLSLYLQNKNFVSPLYTHTTV
nr:MAG TPA_asm: hypothetical protein [Bacteriophage sp.]